MNKEELLLQLIEHKEDDRELKEKIQELFPNQSVEKRLADSCLKERDEQYKLLLKQAIQLLQK